MGREIPRVAGRGGCGEAAFRWASATGTEESASLCNRHRIGRTGIDGLAISRESSGVSAVLGDVALRGKDQPGGRWPEREIFFLDLTLDIKILDVIYLYTQGWPSIVGTRMEDHFKSGRRRQGAA